MMDQLFDRFGSLVLFDVETTGIRHKEDEIIELAALRVTKEGVTDSFDLLVKLSPGRALPAVITDLTGIDEQMLAREGVEKAQAATRFCQMLGEQKPLVVAYNAQFDLCFLYFLLAKHGLSSTLQGVEMLDLLTVYKDRRPYPHKLSDAIAAYALQGENSHRALDDVKATLELMRVMAEEEGDLLHYINLFGFNPKYGVSGPKISSVRYLPQPYNAKAKLYMSQESLI